MLYGASKAITDHIERGEKYSKVRKVYSISIVYFDLGAGDDYVYHGYTHFLGLHTQSELRLSPEQRELYNSTFAGDLYPEYYFLKVSKFNDVAKDTLDEWIYYLKNNRIKDDFTAQGMDKARKVLAVDNLTEEEKRKYYRKIEERLHLDSQICTALYKGRFEGREEVKAIGLEKGDTFL